MPDHPTPKFDLLFTHANLATMTHGRYHIQKNAFLAVKGTTIAELGPMSGLRHASSLSETIVDCRGKWLLPGFVDCHTHMLWAGSRSEEFERRLAGESYEEIAARGGGIAATVKATREASEDELFSIGLKRARHFLTQGITTFEVKSGYGLTLESELKMLSAIGRLSAACPQDVHATFLGAHALPRQFEGAPGLYVRHILSDMLPAVKAQGIATAVDVFCEKIAFSRKQTEQIFQAARDLGFNVKLHAEQLSDSDGAALAAQFQALSCDHLEYLSPKGARAMADHGVCAVLLPGAYHYLGETRKPPIGQLRDLKVPMALATDLNPGTSPVFNMTQILNLACIHWGMTCEEAIACATINGARALGVEAAKGSLSPGKDADITLWDMDTPSDLCYLSGYLLPEQVVISGKIAYKTIQAP